MHNTANRNIVVMRGALILGLALLVTSPVLAATGQRRPAESREWARGQILRTLGVRRHHLRTKPGSKTDAGACYLSVPDEEASPQRRLAREQIRRTLGVRRHYGQGREVLQEVECVAFPVKRTVRIERSGQQQPREIARVHILRTLGVRR